MAHALRVGVVAIVEDQPAAQALREIIIGLGGKMDGFMMKSGFQITVSSEVMAILAVARDLADMRARLGKMVVAYAKNGVHYKGCSRHGG